MITTILTRKILLPIVLLAVFGFLAFVALSNPPTTERRAPSNAPRITVEVQPLELRSYQVVLQSFGTVRPRTQSTLVSQVGGQITSISPKFRDGGFFKAGEVLLSIDPRDYQADVQIAEAVLLDAKRALVEEQAWSAQALKDWQDLGNDKDPSSLVLRKPQLLAAEARAVSANSSLTKAKLSLERTQIVAPFDGRLLKKHVDIGQVISPNTQLAEVFATDHAEIRLPIKNNDLGLIVLPEQNGGAQTKVVLHSKLGRQQTWDGLIVRTEGAIDDVARQLHVVAQVDDPFGLDINSGFPLKIGEYVTAEIEGLLLDRAMVIPNRTIYQGSYVFLVQDGVLRRQTIEISWQNNTDALIRSGLNPGDQLVLTPLGQVTSGTRVQILGEEQAAPERRHDRNAKDQGT